MNLKIVFSVSMLGALANSSYASAPQSADAKKQDEQRTFVTMPAAEVLAKRLTSKGLDHFIEKTKIHDHLGGKKIYPAGVAIQVELSLYDYNQYMKNPMMSMLMQMRKNEMIEALLEDFPGEYKKLEKQLADADKSAAAE